MQIFYMNLFNETTSLAKIDWKSLLFNLIDLVHTLYCECSMFIADNGDFFVDSRAVLWLARIAWLVLVLDASS